jgi:hypothetical protein
LELNNDYIFSIKIKFISCSPLTNRGAARFASEYNDTKQK